MPGWIGKIKARPWVAHLLTALERFGARLGVQFAAAITYFAVLSIVPVLMVAFAALGLTITLLVADVQVEVKAWIADSVSVQGQLGEQLSAVVDQAFGSWQAVGIVGLLTALWFGAAWVDSVRSSVRGMMRADLDLSQDDSNLVIRTLLNIGVLFGVFLLAGLTLAMSTTATTARALVGSLLGLDADPAGQTVLATLPVLGSLLAGFATFCFLFRVLPERRAPMGVLVRGAAIGAVGMALLQYLAGLLVGVFAGNVAAAVFGSVIVVMLYFNLFATLILVVAAWMGTHPDLVTPDVTLADRTAAQPSDYATKKLAAELAAPGTDRVPQAVAIRAARVSLGAGALFGAALAGSAAAVASVLSGLRERRRRG